MQHVKQNIRILSVIWKLLTIVILDKHFLLIVKCHCTKNTQTKLLALGPCMDHVTKITQVRYVHVLKELQQTLQDVY